MTESVWTLMFFGFIICMIWLWIVVAQWAETQRHTRALLHARVLRCQESLETLVAEDVTPPPTCNELRDAAINLLDALDEEQRFNDPN